MYLNRTEFICTWIELNPFAYSAHTRNSYSSIFNYYQHFVRVFHSRLLEVSCLVCCLFALLGSPPDWQCDTRLAYLWAAAAAAVPEPVNTPGRHPHTSVFLHVYVPLPFPVGVLISCGFFNECKANAAFRKQQLRQVEFQVNLITNPVAVK